MGTLIFIGILFTTIIPLFLVMRQADTLFERTKFELERSDEERMAEDLYIYVFPMGGATSTDLKVTAQNKGGNPVKVVRFWINDEITELDVDLEPMSGVQELGTFPLSPQPGDSFHFMATTDRGNIVPFDTPFQGNPTTMRA